MKAKLVDVFSAERFGGNGLTIFPEADGLSTAEMQAITREMRQFESLFLFREGSGFRARIFTLEEELDFAGHPLLGLAYHLHEAFGDRDRHEWRVRLNQRTVELTSTWRDGHFTATMSQGRPAFLGTLTREEAGEVYAALGLDAGGRRNYPAEVVSTGLPYLILPVSGGLERVAFRVPDLSPLLAWHGARFVYVLDIESFEGRTWDNRGRVEDVATGSAAGPAAAYLHKHGLVLGKTLSIAQGRFVGRPSRIETALVIDGMELADVRISGDVIKVADLAFAA
ncbi:PhzF family phenazine biosynthesis protein [Halomonas nitroreducens]|uniref:PhzF family phenazine biosynthesis protein n=1 Tax=Halomonas nitroreducens TaxID=447425 RepID=A0A431V7K3_9GAMM|nr:PhzF family phenazine biosynthesis protein [Halomonas nitroreducens]RTR05908.1 PhzF family phenazine biosynthesis protein [Halomonas nitroreducens]